MRSQAESTVKKVPYPGRRRTVILSAEDSRSEAKASDELTIILQFLPWLAADTVASPSVTKEPGTELCLCKMISELSSPHFMFGSDTIYSLEILAQKTPS